MQRGNLLAFGTDAGVYPHGLNARQLPVMVRLGHEPGPSRAGRHRRTPPSAWAVATSARSSPGRYADLVAVPGHDLGDLSVLQSPALVMKGGRVVTDRTSGTT